MTIDHGVVPSPPHDLIEIVAGIIREVSATEVWPRFRALASDEISTKRGGDLVTRADRAAEAALTEQLTDVRPLPVVGEEATALDPSLVGLVDTEPAVWVVDPIDGTSNFVDGSTDFAVMVALVESGATTASWIWHPATSRMATAVVGAGAHLGGVRVQTTAGSDRIDGMIGVVKHRYLPDGLRAVVERTSDRFGGTKEGRHCAGLDYPDLVAGRVDFLLYWRTLPWDHAPGALFATAAGLRAARPDGSPYRPGDDTAGLLVAHPSTWDTVQQTLFDT